MYMDKFRGDMYKIKILIESKNMKRDVPSKEKEKAGIS